jgi:hypothetical protein
MAVEEALAAVDDRYNRSPKPPCLFIGHFLERARAEVIESPDHFNISRCFLFGFAIPFTHPGLFLNYPVSEDG